ncbi:30S ribosomal protein S6 [Limnoraphis robusta Tam1]|uniref:30S ribosomal protein S6 n=1 Tax=Limnoraphis robusta TaxID=1118279 RepID=UPI002B2054DC|nr:30S ribosomal protein S6 [Limnoraphis robusta]MEA5498610.1 30S ribosomal protein S6 [Limnoraphis robusta BA-68 BA1]MEA5538951.1 30S ribosomal protein S6 [Limnoraphis robusta Tam1]
MKDFVYETMYILRPDLIDEQVDVAIAKYRDLLQEQGGENIQVQNLGKRRLAYEINNHREGVYVQMNYEGPGSQIAVMERAMRISDDVIRYLTTKQPATPVEMPAAVELPEVEVAEPA